MPKIPVKHNFVAIFMILIVLASLVAYSQRSRLNELLHDWKLIPEKETFTELYFDNHLSLPKTFIAGHPEIFSFVIHNLEGRAMDYPYLVFIKTDKGRKKIEDYSVHINDGESRTVYISFMPEETVNSGSVVVSLEGLKQDIHFLIGKSK
jgi:hypothetical protein